MKIRIPLLFVLSLFMLTSCDNILECAFNKRPEIHDKTFKDGIIGVYYYEEVTTEINNEPRDNDYGYNYDFYGELPNGLQMVTNYRTVSFEGTPEVAGTFNFTLYLYVDPPLSYDYDSEQYEDSLCSESTSKDFTITIY
ncbi:hypothetical protein [Psychroserpens sp.]|uniref:hypothetical protein n=1 Tax=Psychroserpens sp. TaxID=2020870 RepID=UPI002B27A965|nr:hypothetical protein [Psychroserpens sp.]